MKFTATQKGKTTNFFILSTFFMLLDPGSAGIEQKIRIRDKHPESATLQAMLEIKSKQRVG